MGRIDRTKNTNEKILKLKDALKDIQDCLDEILEQSENKKPMTQICKEHGIDYLNLRKLFSNKSLENIYLDTNKIVKTADIELSEMEPYEKLCRTVFGVSKDTILEFPVDVEESVEYVIENALTGRERTIIILRYGFTNEGPLMVKDVSERYKVSSERIRQIEAKAVRKMRNPKYAKYLQDGLMKVEMDEKMRLIKVNQLKHNHEQQIAELIKETQEMNTSERANIEYINMVTSKDTIADLMLSVRTYNIVRRAGGIRTVYDLLRKDDEELIKIRNMGMGMIDEIHARLDEYLKEFDMNRIKFKQLRDEYHL